MTNKSWVFAAAFAASLSIAGAASAQNSKFEGFYVGAQAGYSKINVDASVSTLGSADEDLDGFGGGGYFGFGGTNGSLYGSVEVEVGYDGADYDESISVSGVGSASLDLQARLTYGAGFRVGAVVDDNLLIYGRFGWARTNGELDLQVTLTGIGSASSSGDEDFDGFRFGGGVEGMLADNIGIRGEYTYTIYEDQTVNV